jgi:hypothetical protein
LACRCALKIRGCLGGFWYLLSMFCIKAFFFVSLLPFPFLVFEVISLFLTWPSWEFLKDFWVWVHWSVLRPFRLLVSDSPHF